SAARQLRIIAQIRKVGISSPTSCRLRGTSPLHSNRLCRTGPRAILHAGEPTMTGDLYGRFSESFAKHAERTFIEAETRTWSFHDVERAAGRLAARLRGLGVAPGERLLAQTDKSVEALILYFACARLGAIYLPLNVDYTPAELGYF